MDVRNVCVVCEFPTDGKRRCGVVACGPCKRFFLRSFGKYDQMKCSTNLNDCITSKRGISDNIDAAKCKGKYNRFACSRCRYTKCRAAGMRYVMKVKMPSESTIEASRMEKSPEIEISPMSDYIEPHSISEISQRQTEISMASLLEATSNLYYQCENISLRHDSMIKPIEIFNSQNERDIAVFQRATNHFSILAGIFTQFIQALPGYKDVPLHDRCILFANSFTRLTLIEACSRMAKYGYHPMYSGGMTMSVSNSDAVMQSFPELNVIFEVVSEILVSTFYFQYVYSEMSEFCLMLQAWNPSPAELALFLAVLFFDAEQITGLQDPTLVESIQHTYYHLLSNASPSQSDRVDVRSLVSYLRGAQRRRHEAFQSALWRRPELISMSNLFVEVVNKQRIPSPSR